MKEKLGCILEKLPYELTVCQADTVQDIDLKKDFFFICKTDDEISLVCRTKDCPLQTVQRDDGWAGLRIQGVLAFSMVGILAGISAILAEKQISIFAVSTYNTDYILVKQDQYARAASALTEAGYTILHDL